jgi:hypothetical protein
MTSFATFYDPEEVKALEKVLKERRIPFEKRVTTEESGIETIELLASDEHYEAACDITEELAAAQAAEKQERSGPRCPKCGSKHLETIPHETLSWVRRCTDCGCIIAR